MSRNDRSDDARHHIIGVKARRHERPARLVDVHLPKGLDQRLFIGKVLIQRRDVHARLLRHTVRCELRPAIMLQNVSRGDQDRVDSRS